MDDDNAKKVSKYKADHAAAWLWHQQAQRGDGAALLHTGVDYGRDLGTVVVRGEIGDPSSVSLHEAERLPSSEAPMVADASSKDPHLPCSEDERSDDEPADHYILDMRPILGAPGPLLASFWRPMSMGYTHDLRDAGLYPRSFLPARASDVIVHRSIVESMICYHVCIEHLRQGGALSEFDKQQREAARLRARETDARLAIGSGGSVEEALRSAIMLFAAKYDRDADEISAEVEDGLDYRYSVITSDADDEEVVVLRELTGP